MHFKTKRIVVQETRRACPGCNKNLFPRTLKTHRRLFLKPNGIWLEHAFMRAERTDSCDLDPKRSISGDLIDLSSGLIKKLGEKSRFLPGKDEKGSYEKAICGVCGYRCHDEETCFWAEKESFGNEELFECCCLLFDPAVNNTKSVTFDNFLFAQCEFCEKNHPHVLNIYNKRKLRRIKFLIFAILEKMT